MGNRFRKYRYNVIYYILQQYFGIQFFRVSLRHNYKNSFFLQFSRDPVNGLTTFFHASVEVYQCIALQHRSPNQLDMS